MRPNSGGHLVLDRRRQLLVWGERGVESGEWAERSMCDSKNNHEQIYRIHIQPDAICDQRRGTCEYVCVSVCVFVGEKNE